MTQTRGPGGARGAERSRGSRESRRAYRDAASSNQALFVVMADAAWALFGDDDDAAVAASDEKAPPPPRASAHPFFVATRDCWTLEPSDDARSPSLSKEATRASLDLEGRVPALAASLRGRGMHDPADALSGLVETPSAERASDVIAASVRALASASVDDIAASRLNAAILLARAVKADRALDAANEATPSAGDERRPPDPAAAAEARRLAMAAAEAAVLLAECALLVDDPESTGAGGDAVSKNDGHGSMKANRRWIGARVVAASEAAARAERECEKNEKPTRADPSDAAGASFRLRRLATTTDDATRAVIADLRLAAVAEGMRHWDDADRVDRANENVNAAWFYNAHVGPNRPVVFKNFLARDGWRAAETFADLRWLCETYGDTPVPVEVGVGTNGRVGTRAAPRWATLRSFLETYFAKERLPRGDDSVSAATARDAAPAGPATKNAYVSQHSLLHQLPELQDHFSVPDLCLGRLRAANAWLGTADTTTHLHTDDAENVLCQVAGHKLVRLFPPSCDARVYKRASDGKGNGSVNAFSPIDCENVDVTAFPAFAEARKEGTQVILGPGEALFVPRGWWHYARALEPSFSVNFWF